MKLPFKNILCFIFLVLFLGLPFGLKLVDHRFEAYPAVILPSGSGKIYLGDETKIPTAKIYGLTANGRRKELDKSIFLPFRTADYLDAIIKNDFGLKNFNPYNFRTTRFGVQLTLKNKITNEDMKATKNWIRRRLREQHCNDSVLIIGNKQMVILKDGTFYEDEIFLNETVFNLY